MTGKEKIYKVFVEMCRLDPELMGEVCAWNSTMFELDIPEDKDLQKRYIALRKKAWGYVQAMEVV
jgi:hypothetical protein